MARMLLERRPQMPRRVITGTGGEQALVRARPGAGVEDSSGRIQLESADSEVPEMGLVVQTVGAGQFVPRDREAEARAL